MTQKEKQLQFVDLCSRLPYDVKVLIPELQSDAIYTLCGIGKDSISVKKENGSVFDVLHTIDVFPLLRSMSSMTEEELSEYRANCRYHNIKGTIVYEDTYKSFDWLNAHHFDYRGLISMGLGIDCTGLNVYKNEKSM